MSVWKFPTYRDDVLENLCRTYPEEIILSTKLLDTANFNVEEFGDFPVPKNLKPGILKDQLLREKDRVKLSDLYPRCLIMYDEDDSLIKLLKNIDNVRFGLGAVYYIAKEIIKTNKGSEGLTKKEYNNILNTFVVGEMGSYMGPKRNHDFAVSKGPRAEEIISRLNAIRLYSIHLKVQIKNRKHNAKMNTERKFSDEFDPYVFPSYVPNVLPNYKTVLYNNLVYMSNNDFGLVYIFTNKDIDRIYQFVRGFRLHELISEYFTSQEDKKNAALIREIVLGSVGKYKRDNEVCRAWDLIFNYIASPTDVNERSRDELKKKYEEENLNEILTISEVMNAVKTTKLREKIDILNIRKIFPTPDFDYFGVMYRQQKLYEKPNKILVDAEPGETIEKLISYYKYMMVRAYQKRHNKLPGVIKAGVAAKDWHRYWPKVNIKTLDFTFVDDLNLSGCFEYVEIGSDVMKLVKDSAIMPKDDFRNGYELNKLPVEKKNFLADVFSRGADIDIRKIDLNVEDCDVKAEDKPEAKKPNGRLIFEANTEVRLKHSEYERNIADYLKYFPGCAVGLGKDKMDRKMNHITKGVLDTDYYQNFLVSFDLAKFSPHYPGEIHRIFDNVNAELFGKEYLKKASNAHHKGRIHYAKKSILHSIPKPDTDLEGFSGKFNTAIHATVMGLTVNILRTKKIIDQGAKLATFIDDGLACFKVPLRTYERDTARIMKEIERIYRVYGFEISYDKTFQSRWLSVFLHNYIYNGRRLTGSMKAITKLDNHNEGAVESLPDDLNYLEAKTRACLENGTPHQITYLMYSFLVNDTLRRWNKGLNEPKTSWIVWYFTPISMGGLGLKTIMQMCATAEDDIQTGWLSVVFQIRRSNKLLAAEVNRVINQPLKQKDPIDNPTSAKVIRIEGPVLNAVRLKKMVEETIMTNSMFRTRANIMGVNLVQSTVPTVAMKDSRIPVIIRSRVVNSSLIAKVNQITDKFTKSRTAIKIVGRRGYQRIHYANQRDVVNWTRRANGEDF